MLHHKTKRKMRTKALAAAARAAAAADPPLGQQVATTTASPAGATTSSPPTASSNACTTDVRHFGDNKWAGRCKTLGECQQTCADDAECKTFNWWPEKGGCRIHTEDFKTAGTNNTDHTTIAGPPTCRYQGNQIPTDEVVCCQNANTDAWCTDLDRPTRCEDTTAGWAIQMNCRKTCNVCQKAPVEFCTGDSAESQAGQNWCQNEAGKDEPGKTCKDGDVAFKMCQPCGGCGQNQMSVR